MQLLLIVKLVSMVVDPLETAAGALIPWALGRSKNAQRLMGLASASAAGIFFSVGLCHMAADAGEYLEPVALHAHGLPLSLFLMCMGFCVMLLLDQVVFPHEHDHSYTHDEKAPLVDEERATIKTPLLDASINGELPSPPANKSPERNTASGSASDDSAGEEAAKVHAHAHHAADAIAAVAGGKVDPKTSGLVKAAVITAGVMLHSSICGLAIGVSRDLHSCITIIVACLAHDWSHACALIVLYRQLGLTKFASGMFFGAFVLVEPLATGLGLAVTSALSNDSATIASGVLSAISSGVFLYISVCELLQEALNQAGDRLLKFGLFFVFVVGIASVSVIEG